MLVEDKKVDWREAHKLEVHPLLVIRSKCGVWLASVRVRITQCQRAKEPEDTKQNSVPRNYLVHTASVDETIVVLVKGCYRSANHWVYFNHTLRVLRHRLDTFLALSLFTVLKKFSVSS